MKFCKTCATIRLAMGETSGSARIEVDGRLRPDHTNRGIEPLARASSRPLSQTTAPGQDRLD
jgi:hypothetical protein